MLVKDDKVVSDDGEEPLAPEGAEAVGSDAATPPAMRRQVLARDGLTCVHCRSRRGLHVHHVQWRSKGGATTPRNLVTLCARCHGLVHEGLLDVKLAQCASAGPRPTLVFRDANERLLERRAVLGDSASRPQRLTPGFTWKL